MKYLQLITLNPIGLKSNYIANNILANMCNLCIRLLVYRLLLFQFNNMKLALIIINVSLEYVKLTLISALKT